MFSILRRPRFAFCLLLATAACRRGGVHVSLQPREPARSAAPAESAPGAAPAAAMERPHPHFSWKLPEGWQDTGPGQMSVASFEIKTAEGHANVTITPLPNLAGKEAVLVNMWREQVGAPPLSPEDASKALSAVEVAGGQGQLFEVSGTGEGHPIRILTAIAQSPTASWFYKLSGDDAVVAAQKPAFLEFLKSVVMQENPPAAAAPSGQP